MQPDQFISRARDKFGDRFDYSMVNLDHGKIYIICPEHGTFYQTPVHHLRSKYGCTKCGLSKHNNSIKLSTSDFIDRARRIHGSAYDYSVANYVNGRSMITIICRTHGLFEQFAENHLAGKGCEKCCWESMSRHFLGDTQEIIDRFRDLHGRYYDYSQFAHHGMKKKSIIICPVHGAFNQTPHGHLRGNGCRKCKLSIGERRILQWLTNAGIIYISEKSFDDLIGVKGGKLRYDFYLPDLNTCIEFDGVQHSRYCPSLLGVQGRNNTLERFDIMCRHDRLKNDYCQRHNIRLLRITYKELRRIESILDDHIT